jgi:Uma2 family endonuclease
MTAPPKPSSPEEIVYPDSDGKPMAENTLQFRWIVVIKEGLELVFADRRDVFVAGDLLWYPVEGHPEIRAAPDAMVAVGRPKGDRGSYMQWKEDNIPPQVVWEVLSPGNTRAELEEKFDFYERYGVEEYYQYDPDRGRLRGWTRVADRLHEVHAMQGWVSPRTGVRIELSGVDLVLTAPNGEPFRTFIQTDRLRKEAEALALREGQRAEVEQRHAEEQRRLAEEHLRQAQEQQRRAEQERQRAEHERQRAERMAARLREMGIDPEA